MINTDEVIEEEESPAWIETSVNFNQVIKPHSGGSNDEYLENELQDYAQNKQASEKELIQTNQP